MLAHAAAERVCTSVLASRQQGAGPACLPPSKLRYWERVGACRVSSPTPPSAVNDTAGKSSRLTLAMVLSTPAPAGKPPLRCQLKARACRGNYRGKTRAEKMLVHTLLSAAGKEADRQQASSSCVRCAERIGAAARQWRPAAVAIHGARGGPQMHVSAPAAPKAALVAHRRGQEREGGEGGKRRSTDRPGAPHGMTVQMN